MISRVGCAALCLGHALAPLAQMAAVPGVSRIMGPARMRALLAVPGTSPGR
jgi:hypothetical protein